VPASLIQNLQDVNTSTKGSKITFRKSTHTVINKLSKDIYDYCYYNDSFASPEGRKRFHSQGSILRNIARNGQFDSEKGMNGAPCMYFDGLYEYFNLHIKEYHGEDAGKW
jgi:hypothetical protein